MRTSCLLDVSLSPGPENREPGVLTHGHQSRSALELPSKLDLSIPTLQTTLLATSGRAAPAVPSETRASKQEKPAEQHAWI